MPLRRFPRIVGFEVPPLNATVDVVRDPPIVGLLSLPPTRPWLDAFIIEAALTRSKLGDAMVSVDGTRVLFYASSTNARAQCKAVRDMVEKVSRQILAGTPSRPPGEAVGIGKTEPRKVLLVEDDEVLLDVTAEVLRGGGWTVTAVTSATGATAALNEASFHVVMTDIDLESPGQGLVLAEDVHRRWPRTGIVVATGLRSEVVPALPEGALLLTKPYQRRQLLTVLNLVSPSGVGPG
ncbi:response regulator [Luteibacter aegosomaticola]|uniref:response regulator n=1 Tax=Luteibacter aegosomaticola TaxID=2911538 RepID=UPI001FF96FD6|nr:response regulator [Luteibacter aegosomaticola]UPG88302.1 response regulator [Luteibacter aegosomaticola]